MQADQNAVSMSAIAAQAANNPAFAAMLAQAQTDGSGASPFASMLQSAQQQQHEQLHSIQQQQNQLLQMQQGMGSLPSMTAAGLQLGNPGLLGGGLLGSSLGAGLGGSSAQNPLVGLVGARPAGGGSLMTGGASSHALASLVSPSPGAFSRSGKGASQPGSQFAGNSHADDRAKKAKEEAAKAEDVEKLRCHLHKKPNKACKFCKKYQEATAPQEKVDKDASKAGGAKAPSRPAGDLTFDGKLEVENKKTFGFSTLLQTHILESAHFKSLLNLESFEEVVDEIYQYADCVEPYMANSATVPSAMFCCLYRLFTVGIDSRQLRQLVDHRDSPYIRCVGFMFIRLGLPPEKLWPWLGEYSLDEEEFKPTKESEWKTTIGEYVESLLNQDKYYSTVLPRMPMSAKRQLEEKLAPVPQYRKRTKANMEMVETYREEGVKVEACLNSDWLSGVTMELIEDAPARIKVRVRLEDDTEEVVPLGKVILTDRRYGGTRGGTGENKGGGGSSGRSRSPHGMDWVRSRGRTDVELVSELRSAAREKAVCSSGKEYARKPLGYKAACALPREQGAASHRLMEEETFVPMNRNPRKRSPSPTREPAFARGPSQEHQEKMKQLFEKYGMAKGPSEASKSSDVERADFMRLG